MSGRLRWLGLSFVQFTTADGKVILFDPWVRSKGNPSCPLVVNRAAEAVRLMAPRQAMPMQFEWNPAPLHALGDFNAFCAQKAPDVRIIAPLAGVEVDI